MPSPSPSWETPAHLRGPRIGRKMFEVRGTMADCVEAFLSLAHHHQQDCELSPAGSDSPWGPGCIRAYVKRNGPPPASVRASRDLYLCAIAAGRL
jgi:hypothetical protein